jgi:hypothetical protein
LGVTAMLMQFGLLMRWSDTNPIARRLFVLGGLMEAMLLVLLFGFGMRAPLRVLNGVNWSI